MLSRVYIWNKAPFIRLLLCFITGILLQWHIQFSINTLYICTGPLFFILILYTFLQVKTQYRFRHIIGLSLQMLIVVTGAFVVWVKDIRHHPLWIGNYNANNLTIATLQEPLVEKANSYKALATVIYIKHNDTLKKVKGNIIIYFKKDTSFQSLSYGTRLAFIKPLQEIKNSGNPGSFDYKRYSLFNGITHQLYVTQKDIQVLPQCQRDHLKDLVFQSRDWVVHTLKKFIDGKKEAGLAEALLIGYKDDLDKNLVESYSNTGVVHVIAISGLHLGLIYWLLLQLTKPLKKFKRLRWLRLLMILLPLWAFTFLAGAQPSVLRSAVMFTCIAIGEVIARKTSIYNLLALSAFMLLCWNPYWLWDVGFQLSYAAVLSIVTFFRPIYNWLYFTNKAVDFLWKLNAVTIAAQLLTVPISIYHFHQFPVLFLITNLLAVPLSSMILMGELALCILSFIAPLANVLGKVLYWLIYFLNTYIENLDKLSFAVWPSLSISLLQAFLLICLIMGFCYWLMEKQKAYLWVGMVSLFCFVCLRAVSFARAYNQQKFIVYNVPKHRAIDIIAGRHFYFIGDSVLLQDGFIRNFHLNPSRILHRVERQDKFPLNIKSFSIKHNKFLIIDAPIAPAEKRHADIIILSGNPKLYISQLAKTYTCKLVVIDSSVPGWKAKLWKKDCDALNIPYFDVSEKGAFVMYL